MFRLFILQILSFSVSLSVNINPNNNAFFREKLSWYTNEFIKSMSIVQDISNIINLFQYYDSTTLHLTGIAQQEITIFNFF